MDEDEYRLDYFEDNGFVRKTCPGCGRGFWTRDASKESCGEPPCDEYSFIGNPPFEDEFTLEGMREEFLSFFEDSDHERVEPYPVDASRWRDDVLLTQASIYDFQPLVTSGETPPPANPLCISQPCIRMQDIDNVGKTGRHTLAFEMMAHHAFNSRTDDGAYEGEVYWKEETVAYCDGFLEHLGAPLDEVTYVESPWVGGGNAGPAFEVILRGAEVATLVFMDLELDEDGEYEMKDGKTYSKMDNYIVDTGYGLERFAWLSQGTPTVYEAIYPDMVDEILDAACIERADEEILADVARLAGKMDADEVDDLRAVRQQVAEDVGLSLDELDEILTPVENAFGVADHTRVLAYMLGDGIVPSNVGTGYLARLVLRRTVRLADEIGLDVPLEDLVDEQAKRLGYRNRDVIEDVVREEVEKYEETLERGGRLVRRKAEEYAGEGSIPNDELVEMYDSHGIQPDTVAEIADQEGVDVDVPDDFYAQVADRHEERESAEKDDASTGVDDDLPETDLLFYDDVERTEFEAVVLNTYYDEDDESYEIVLDQTRFYPEGGGQPPDTGVLENGEVAHVEDVQKRDGVVFHRTDKPLSKGDVVRGQVDPDRRRALMRNHTATHTVIDAARRVLGDHVRQAGAQKGVESSRIDITHHKRLTDDDVREIERVANETVRDNVQVDDEWLDRHEAEEEHGFGLYQGGIPAGEEIRVVHVDDDVQACGGTHVRRTGDIGYIKVRNTERIQDGVERIVFSAGDAAVEASQEVERVADEASDVFGVPRDDLPATAERFFDEWKERGKRVDELRSELAEIRAEASDDDTVEIEGVPVVTRRMDAGMDELRTAANTVVDEGKVAVFAGGDGSATVVVGVPENTDVDAGDVAGELSSFLGGDGGGSPAFGQGGGPDTEKVNEALEESKRIIEEQI
ncbi:alanine--tRNA ligase [Haladaptatus sp. F3-133]|uniref:Alanine--tRNA ligase n=1 Tax=Halorutilus salinus TaxID=2487751 RepID=A0A9Q4C451_9EURY|nr:alanine--tRNA ligase [Halorutilus salinus]MCX2819522.1 alanine--tRNA ligase [Halorutilus salinus]